jgi:hypothetical protein
LRQGTYLIAKGQGKNKERKFIKIGYAGIHSDRNPGLQMDVLNKAGCINGIFVDQGVEGATIEREGLSQAIAAAGKGDVFALICGRC